MTTETQQLENAIKELDTKRVILGDAVVDTALAPMRAKLESLKSTPPRKEELKYVTILFVDVTGSTRMARSLDPEDLRDIISGGLGRFRKVVEKYGGRVTRYLGDGFMSLFGTPVAREDDAEMAVRAGLDILQAAREYSQQIVATWGLSGFDVRVGINTGQVVTGGELEDDNFAIGMAIHIAQRMESAAPTGACLVSHSTYRHIRGIFNVQAQPPLNIKGRDTPVRSYLVQGIQSTPDQLSGRGIEGISTPFVGRERELNDLKLKLSDFLTNSITCLTSVIGDPGIGKSRLLLELKNWLNQTHKEVLILEGRASQQSEHSPYCLLRDVFRNHLRINDGDSSRAVHQKIEQGLSLHFSQEGQMKAHFIGALLGYDFSESPYLAGIRNDPGQLRKRGSFYLEQLFQELCQNSSVALLLDDTHLADQTSLDFIQQISSQAEFPIALFCIARPELIEHCPDWSRYEKEGVNQSRMYLYPLSQKETDQLLEAILQHVNNIPVDLYKIINQYAEGNPFYIEEIVNTMIDEGVIIKDHDPPEWQIDLQKLSEFRIPRTLTALLQSRIDSLPIEEKDVLQTASVIGRIFWDEAILELIGPDIPLNTILMDLSDRDLIYPRFESAFQDMDEFIFKNIMMRDVTYEGILKSRRRSSHARIASWLERAASEIEREAEFSPIIANHWELAHENAKAAYWYLQAAIKVKHQGVPNETRDLIEHALKLAPASDHELMWAINLELSELHGITGEIEARQVDDQKLLDLAMASNNNSRIAEAYYRQGSNFMRKGEDRNAIKQYELALDAARTAGDKRLESITLAVKVVSLTRLGELEDAEAHANLAIEMASNTDDEEVIARTLTNASIYYAETGDLAKAIQLSRQQIAINHRANNRIGEVIGLINLGYDYVQIGKYATAEQTLLEAMNLSESIGSRRENAYSRLNLSLALFRSAEYQSARKYLDDLTPELDYLKDKYAQASQTSYLALVLEATDDLEAAIEYYQNAQQKFTELGVLSYANDALAGLAKTTFTNNEPEIALGYAEELWTYLNKNGPSGMEFPIRAYLTCANIFFAHRKKELATEMTRQGYQEVIQRANRISNESWRNSYLENVSEHCDIIRLHAQIE